MQAYSTTRSPAQKIVSIFKSFDLTFYIGLLLVLLLVVFGALGQFFIDQRDIRLGASSFSSPPSAEHLFGTDALGRDLLTLLILATPTTLNIGVVTAVIATSIGTFLGLVTGYFRGPLETGIRTLIDIMIAIPALLILVSIASFLPSSNTVIAVILAIFAWPFTARPVRAQVLSLRERAFVKLSKLSKRSDFEIIFFDMLPNITPFIAAGFVSTVSNAILAAVGLQLLGIGPIDEPSIGLVLQEAFFASAVFRELWWWWIPPMIMLSMIFIGLFLISLSLDRIARH